MSSWSRKPGEGGGRGKEDISAFLFISLLIVAGGGGSGGPSSWTLAAAVDTLELRELAAQELLLNLRRHV